MGKECPVCHHINGETVKSQGLLQPLCIPKEPWRNIAMDFITGLRDMRLFGLLWTGLVGIVTLSRPISAKSLATTFFEQIYRLYGMPEFIVSERESFS